jgi:hypothetical protein
MSTDVTTRSFDPARTGANTSETILTPAAVGARGVRVVLTLTTPDDPRLEAQPLYLSKVPIKGQTRDAIYQATMGNTVYCWDADTGELLWQTKLGMPITGTSAIDAHQINVHWGILSTPVIDRAAGVLYACAWISTDGTGNSETGQHFVAALDVATGAMAKPLLSLEGVTFDPGHGLPKLAFRSMERKQRSALALAGGALVICFGTIQETAQGARGWVVAVDVAHWAVGATWCSTARGSGGGIWMSGAGPAVQSDGSIWVVTGNGDFDGQTDFGESVVHLRYVPGAAGRQGAFQVLGWWAPWTDHARTGGDPEGEQLPAAEKAVRAKLPKASNFRKLLFLARQGMAVMDADWGDQDLAASGIVLVESLGIGLVSGKDGILYTIKLKDPGETTPGDLTVAKSPANYARLAAAPILYTYFDRSVDPATPNPTALNRWPGNVTHHLHGTPLFWVNATHGSMHFCGGENGNLRAWALGPNAASTYLGCSAAYASADAVASPNPNGPKGGMPGWSLALSANGTQDGIVWGMIPYGDANMALTGGRLLAYDAAHLSRYSDGSGEVVPIWDSQQWNWNFLHPKFNRPVAVDGKVLVPTYDGRLLVLGLA